MRASLLVVVVFGSATLGACGSSSLTGSTGTGGTVGNVGSPGTVTFVLSTPAGTSFCDQLSCAGGNPHLSILTTDGTELNWQGAGGGCVSDCGSCQPVPCPQVAILCPAPEGVVYTGGTMTWNGSVTNMLTCGAAHMTCSHTGFEHPGSYVARFCATPGTVTQADAGLPVCSATGGTVCTETTFDFPAAGTVRLTLPAGQAGLD